MEWVENMDMRENVTLEAQQIAKPANYLTQALLTFLYQRQDLMSFDFMGKFHPESLEILQIQVSPPV